MQNQNSDVQQSSNNVQQNNGQLQQGGTVESAPQSTNTDLNQLPASGLEVQTSTGSNDSAVTAAPEVSAGFGDWTTVALVFLAIFAVMAYRVLFSGQPEAAEPVAPAKKASARKAKTAKTTAKAAATKAKTKKPVGKKKQPRSKRK